MNSPQAKGYARMYSQTGKDWMTLCIATDGQSGIRISRENSREALAVARSIPSGTHNRRKLIVDELKSRNLM